MATAEWIINAAKKKIYAISHAKAVVRGNSTVDADLSSLESNLGKLEQNTTNLQEKVNSLNLDEIKSHLKTGVNSTTGVHNLRYYDTKLQVKVNNTWIDIETGDAASGLAPGNMKSVSVELGMNGTSLVLKSSDPDDIVLEGGTTLVKWAGTKVVRKVGSCPQNARDGVLVVDYQVADQYKDNGYIDTGLVTGTTYYYRWFPYSDKGTVNLGEDEANKATGIPKNQTILGVTVDFTNKIYVRTNQAIGLNGGSDFDQFEMYGGRRRCIVADNGTILAYYGDAAYTETGALKTQVRVGGATYKVGTYCQVMVVQPKFYYKMTPITLKDNPYGTGKMVQKATYQVAPVQYSGFKVHPCFVRDGEEIPYILLSAYECGSQGETGNYLGSENPFNSMANTTGNTIDDIANSTNKYLYSIGNMLASIADVYPAIGYDSSFSIENARTKAEMRGAEVNNNNWGLGDFLSISMTQLLFLIEYSSFDSQYYIGPGNTERSSSNQTINPTGGTTLFGNDSTQINSLDGYSSVSYRGEENLWGNVFTWVDGINLYNNNSGFAYWADSNFDSSSTTGSYQSTGFNFARKSGFISAFGYSSDCDWAFIPCQTEGDSMNPVGDYFEQSVISNYLTVPAMGGSCLSCEKAGLFQFSSIYTNKSSLPLIGARLLYVPHSK